MREWKLLELEICPERKKKINHRRDLLNRLLLGVPVSLRNLMSRLFVSAAELAANSSVDTFLKLCGHVAVMLFVKLSAVMSRVSSAAACRALTGLAL